MLRWFTYLALPLLILPFLVFPFVAPAVNAATDTTAAPIVNARAWLLVDHHSGRRLAFKNTDHRFSPTDFNKLMVAYIALNAIKRGEIADDTQILISQKATHSTGPRMFVSSSSRVTARNLIKAMIVGRANDAAIALAEHIGSDEQAFVRIMNNEVQTLRLNNTYFFDATGNSHTRQYTDADDLAVLTQRIIRDHPRYYHWFKQREFSHNGMTLYNRNALLWREKNVDGLMAVNSGNRDGHHLIVSGKRDTMRLSAIVLGAPNERAAIAAASQLLKFGFEQFETRKLYDGNTGVVNMRVWLGEAETLPVGVINDLYLTLTRGEFDNLRAILSLTGPPFAPIERGQHMGTLKLVLQNKTISEHGLVSLGSIAKGGFFSRIFDRAEMWLRDVPGLAQAKQTK